LKTNLNATIEASRQTTPTPVAPAQVLNDDDKDLKRAIEESMKPAQQYDDDHDEELKRAIEESLKPIENDDEELKKAIEESMKPVQYHDYDDDDLDFKRAIEESMKPAHISKKLYISNNEDEEYIETFMQSLIYM